MPGPTAFAEQHAIIEAPRVDEDTFRPYWRIVRPQTRLDRLRADGAISEDEWSAGRRFRHAVETLLGTGVDRRYDREGGGDNGRSSGIVYSLMHRHEAENFVRRVRAGIGPFAITLVWSCVVDDAPWATVGARLNVDAKTARRWTIVALQALALIEQS